MFYGITRHGQIEAYAQDVCRVLGNGESGLAVRMLLETCAQETHLGMFRDESRYGAGVGLYQMDEIGYLDVMQHAKEVDRFRLHQNFGIQLDEVEYRELAFSPLLATVFARLFYKRIPESFPLDLPGRARYWKRYYNTKAGKGTETEYIANVQRLLP